MRPSLTRREMLLATASEAGVLALPTWAGEASIHESGFVPIGGIEQWIAIDGENIRNPAIVFLHGGPAEAQSPFLKEFIPWEHDFTVVNWDQRGSGKTFGKYGPATPGMSTPDQAVAQMTQDAIEVVEYACRRLAKRKVILVGHSWGSTLGLRVAKQRPELLYAFAGTGQQVSWPLTVQSLDRWAQQQAMRAGDQATLAELARVSSLPPSDMRRLAAARKYRMSPPDLEYLRIQADFIGKTSLPNGFMGNPQLPKHGDVADWVAGGAFSIQRLLPAAMSFDARKLGLSFAVPIFVIQGRDDHVVSFEAARDYLAEVQAPRKAFVAIDGGHFACFTDPVEFVGALRSLARPLAR